MSERDPFSFGGHTQPLVARRIEAKQFPSALASPQRVPVLDPVVVLAAERKRLIDEGLAAQDVVDKIMLEQLPRDRTPFVVLGYLRVPGGHNPIYAFTEEAIRAHFDGLRLMFGDDHPVGRHCRGQEERLVAALQAQEAERVAVEEAAGHTAASKKASELVSAWCRVEDQLMGMPATTVEGLIAQLDIYAENVKNGHAEPDDIDEQIAVFVAGIRAIAGDQP